jgi:hypothetical protein
VARVVAGWTVAWGVFVLLRTHDPVRALGVVWIAGVVLYALLEGHRAWRDDAHT